MEGDTHTDFFIHHTGTHVHKDTVLCQTTHSCIRVCVRAAYLCFSTCLQLNSTQLVSYRYGCAGGSQACWQRSRLPPAQSVCGWWRSALSAGWSPPGWPTEWPHLCAEPTACCHPSFSGFLPEEERGIQTRCHADKLIISIEGRCPQINPSFTCLSFLLLPFFFLIRKPSYILKAVCPSP